MTKHDTEWHKQDILDEYEEYKSSHGIVEKWSEMSDVYYTYSRARADRHVVEYPLPALTKPLAILYMLPKFSLRYLFYYRAGKKLNPTVRVRAVRNPKKIEKLHQIANKHQLDPDRFRLICERQLKYWPLLK